MDKPTRIPVPQERFLLAWHATHNAGCKRSTLVALLSRGLIADVAGSLVVTPSGRAYCDAWHASIA